MRYEHAVEGAVVEAVLSQKASKLALDAFTAGINARQAELLLERFSTASASADEEEAKVGVSLVAAYTSQAAKAAVVVAEMASRRDAISTRLTKPIATQPLQEWANNRLPQLEAEHIAHKTVLANADVLTAEEGFQSAEYHTRCMVEIDAAWQATKEALEAL